MIITNLLTNMVVVSMMGFLSKGISQKPEFQNYAHQAMFQQASNLIMIWNLDLPRPITTNMISRFSASSYNEGINGVMVLSNRYTFGWYRGKLDQFKDELYVEGQAHTDNVDTNDAILEQWMRATNLLTMEKARVIAESAMQSVGVPMGKGKFKKLDYQTQLTYDWKDNKRYPMPFYRFRWKGDGVRQSYDYEVQVSGITSNVLYCSFLSGSRYVKSINPTNYFTLLGLPSNPVFVVSRERPLSFMPPLISSNGIPVQQTYQLYTNLLINKKGEY